MLVETAETLKRELTDKYVVVADNVPELRRFVGLTGIVKTVNMNGRALVQFDGPADIGWYDIDPSYLTVVDAPLPKKKETVEEHAAPAAKTSADKPAPKKAAGLSPLEMARQQGAAKAGAAAPAKSESPAADKKLSPLELARQQGAAKSGQPAAANAAGLSSPSVKPSAGAPPAAAEPAKKLSPLELARQQGAAKRGSETTAPAASTEVPVAVAAEQSEAAQPSAATAVQTDNTAGLSKLELARRQGPAKR